MRPGDAPARAMDAINVPYLLVTGIPCHTDQAGGRWTDPLWHKDLIEHLRYLPDFILASPQRRDPPPPFAACLTADDRFARVRYVDLPYSASMLAGVLNFPQTFLNVFRAAGGAALVHAGVADWPIPTGWSATLAAKLRHRLLLINIESAFWRITPGTAASCFHRTRAKIWEAMNRWCVRRADLQLFTQRKYAEEFLADPAAGHIFNASWIDEDNLLSDEVAKENWDRKDRAPPGLLYAGRLTEAKGIPVLMEALRILERDGIKVHLDVIGDGPLLPAVRDLSCDVRVLPTVPYGAEFFSLLRNYHALVVPSITDEQPRIVYDGFSQAVPVLGTNAPGVAACVKDGETGWLAAPGDAAAFAALIRRAIDHRADLRRMGMAGLAVARGYTHREMHRQRWMLLDKTLRDQAR